MTSNLIERKGHKTDCAVLTPTRDFVQPLLGLRHLEFFLRDRLLLAAEARRAWTDDFYDAISRMIGGRFDSSGLSVSRDRHGVPRQVHVSEATHMNGDGCTQVTMMNYLTPPVLFAGDDINAAVATQCHLRRTGKTGVHPDIHAHEILFLSTASNHFGMQAAVRTAGGIIKSPIVNTWYDNDWKQNLRQNDILNDALGSMHLLI